MKKSSKKQLKIKEAAKNAAFARHMRVLKSRLGELKGLPVWVSAGGGTCNHVAGVLARLFDVPFSRAVNALDSVHSYGFSAAVDWIGLNVWGLEDENGDELPSVDLARFCATFEVVIE